ncbi:hypothetical protein Cgig2_001045 [Carnegiea gigantea]|uniref:DUF4283 domain-containing protein n=1 Tax=Carnegiea gigantea TaxID=171969 RepID=A0A9Q1JIR2_9CARY|nr:hypothetical protein Cgig2_001045 [Carnegiea gigantea]
MASGLEDACQNMKLTDEEVEVVVFDDEGSDDKLEQFALLLYGNLHTAKSFNSRVMKNQRRVWSSTILMTTFSPSISLHQPTRRPWAFDGKILLLKEITGMEVPSEVEFRTARFWVKAYDLPAKKQTIAFAQCLGNQLGTLVGCEVATMFGVDPSLCFRVDIDVTKPLCRGVNVKGLRALYG